MIAYYSASIAEFISCNPDEILGVLTKNHRHDLEHLQRDAWQQQIVILQSELAQWPNGQIYFEFIIPRMGKRADCLLIIEGIIFILEFKVHAQNFDRPAIEQCHDYALDMKNFHKGSHHLPIAPVLIATQAKTLSMELDYAADGVANPLKISADTIHQAIAQALQQSNGPAIDVAAWSQSGYLPTPTIIEAARALYENHDVKDIARSDAGAKNLQATNAYVAKIIETSRSNQRKSICFITGVPGAGKTLAGLNIATERAAKDHHKGVSEQEHAVFLSGNGPLVDVLREALARDQSSREKIKKSEADRRVRSFVQNIHHFRDEYLRETGVPIEKVVVFDEAQRAWSVEQASNFMQRKRGIAGFAQSEPEFLISVMDRHQDWCTIVCLIGGGQELNTGEAGLQEWLSALTSSFPHWDVYASALLDDPHYTVDQQALTLLSSDKIIKASDLHLSVSMRSFRAEKLSVFVGALLDNNRKLAADLFDQLKSRYPIWVTRDLSQAKAWLRQTARGSERTGLVASSGAHRLRAEGINVKAAIEVTSWFLNDCTDVRSSYYLEEVATEFDVQGLELDWVGICWDADLRYGENGFGSFAFRGSKWQNVQAEQRQLYLKNAYRVLLTRARQGMVIYVPNGDDADPTRPKAFYDQTFAYLKSCGIPIVAPQSPSVEWDVQ